jgi:hypothetical protein
MILPDLQSKGLCSKEAFLLKAFFVTFVATKVTAIPRQLSGLSCHLPQNIVNT